MIAPPPKAPDLPGASSADPHPPDKTIFKESPDERDARIMESKEEPPHGGGGVAHLVSWAASIMSGGRFGKKKERLKTPPALP